MQVSKLEAFTFPCGSLSFSADTAVNLGCVKINTDHSLIGVDPHSEAAGAKGIHTESLGRGSSVSSSPGV